MRAQLASVAVPVRMVAGHDLFEEGDAADSFYVLQEGAWGGGPGRPQGLPACPPAVALRCCFNGSKGAGQAQAACPALLPATVTLPLPLRR